MTLQRAGKATVRHQERQVKALELRRKGESYKGIARTLGVAVGTAHALVQEALVETLREPAAAVRTLELERLDFITKKLETRIMKGDDKAINTVLRVMDHRAKLLGLYAPVTLQGPGGSEIRFVVELPAQAPSLADWQAQAATVIDVTPTLEEKEPGHVS